VRIWVDADACPRPAKEILYRAAERTGVPLTLVANRMLETPRSALIEAIQVSGAIDAADDWIADAVAADDLVITADIPLAARVVEKGAYALSPHGDLFTGENIRERLNLRDFMDTLRGSGVNTGGPAAYGPTQRQAFANGLDRFLAGHRVE